MGEVISLGIQLCDRIAEYVQDYNTSDEQLGAVLRRAQHLRHILEYLDRHIRRSAPTLPEASHNVSAAMSSCDTELRALKDLVYRLAPTLPLTADRKGKTRETVKKAMFPFKRDDVEKLERRLDKTIQVLLLAMESLQLDSQLSLSSGQTAMHDSLQQLGSNQSAMHSDLTDLRAKLEEVQTTILSWTTQSVHGKGHVMAVALASPSALKGVCDVVSESEKAIHSGGHIKMQARGYRTHSRACDCRPRFYKYTRASPSLLSFSLEEEVTKNRLHRPDCVYSKLNPIETSRRLALTYTGLRRYISTAISVGFRADYDAGGSSIGPVLRYSRTVDSRTSPVFILLQRLALAIEYTCWFSNLSSVENKVVQRGLETLQSLYGDGRASPCDVDEYGATALTSFCDTFRVMPNYNPLWSVISNLLDLGVPTQGVGLGREAQPVVHQILDLYTNSTRDIPSVGVIPKLINHSEGNFTSTPYDYSGATHPLSIIYRSPGMWEDIAEVYGLDSPLALALLHKDEAKLLKVLSQREDHPLSLKEGNSRLLDFAVEWHVGLQMILDRPSATDINLYLSDGNTVAQAMKASVNSCKLRGYEAPLCDEGCICFKNLELLLVHGSVIDLSLVRWASCSLRAVRFLMSHVKYWREKLTDLARSELTLDDQVRLGLTTRSVLDGNTSKVVRLLRSRNIDAGQRLGLQRRDDRLNDSDNPFSGSIYHQNGLTKDVACTLFSLGFEEIDCADRDGLTPVGRFIDDLTWIYIQNLKQFPGFSRWILTWGYPTERRFLTWLLDKNVCLSSQFYEQTELPRPAHTVLHRLASVVWFLGICEQDDLESRVPPPRLMAGGAMHDGCDCSCSDSATGCSPMHIFLLHYIRACFEAFGDWTEAVDGLNTYLGADESIVTLTSKPLLRLLAFEALGLRHTCCFNLLYQGEPATPYNEDFDEIRTEDAPMLESLKQLISTLTARFEESGGSIFTFLDAEGLDLILNMVDDVNGADLTQEGGDGIEAVGVRLVQGPNSEKRVGTTVNDYRYHARNDADTFEFWAGEFARIQNGDFSQPDFTMRY